MKSGKKSSDIWPNLFIVGAPRSGSTTLYNMLASSPDIFMSEVKEPCYFTTLPLPERHKMVHQVTQDKDEYLGLFKDGIGYKYRGEASPRYLADPEAPKLIKQASPNAKIIAILRNPVDRAHSAYLLINRRGGNDGDFYDKMQKDIDDFNSNRYDPMNLLRHGMYSRHLQNYYKHFSKDQVLVLDFEDLKKNPEFIRQQLSGFLDLPIEDFASSIPQKNSHTAPRNKLALFILRNERLASLLLRFVPRDLIRFVRNNILLKKAPKPKIDPTSKALLENFYSDEITDFENLLSKNQSEA